MFTNFHGFHLVEAYHKWKKEHRGNKNPIGIKMLKLLIAVGLPLFMWFAPSAWFGLPDLNPVQHRVMAIFALRRPDVAMRYSVGVDYLTIGGCAPALQLV